MREKYEPLIWSYLGSTVSHSVQEYQVEVQQPTLSRSSPERSFTPEELGELLVKAVESMTPPEVCKYPALYQPHTLLEMPIHKCSVV